MENQHSRKRSLPSEGTPKRKKLRVSTTAPQASVPQKMAAQMMTFRLVGSPKRKCFPAIYLNCFKVSLFFLGMVYGRLLGRRSIDQ